MSNTKQQKIQKRIQKFIYIVFILLSIIPVKTDAVEFKNTRDAQGIAFRNNHKANKLLELPITNLTIEAEFVKKENYSFFPVKGRIFNFFLRKCSICCLVLSILALSLVYQNSSQTTFQASHVDDTSKPKLDAFVLIATGKYSRTNMPDKLLSSMEGVLPSSMPICLLTDRTNCFTDLDRWPTLNVKLVEVPATDSAIAAQLYKTQIFHYIPREINNVLYLDTDMKVNPFNLNRLPTLEDKAYKDCAIIMQKGRPFIEKGVNSGTFIVHREKSKECLKAWEENTKRGMGTGEYATEQDAFEDTPLCMTNMCYMPSGIVFFARSFNSLIPPIFLDTNPNTAPFVHYQRKSRGTKKYFKALCKKWDKTSLPYCWASIYNPNIFLVFEEKDYC